MFKKPGSVKQNIFTKIGAAFFGSYRMKLKYLKKDLKKQDYKFAVRLNGTSDLSFERFKHLDGQTLMDVHPDVQFYDYTKVYNRLTRDINNYYMVFSYSGRNEVYCRRHCIEAITSPLFLAKHYRYQILEA